MVCATEPPASETEEETEARGNAEMQCRAEWLNRVQDAIAELKECAEGCLSDDDCGLKEKCLDGVCRDYYYCSTDEHCEEMWGSGKGYRCIQNDCEIVKECEDDLDCLELWGEGYYCLNKECVLEGECNNDADCVQKHGAGYECVNYKCWEKETAKPTATPGRNELKQRFKKEEMAPEEPEVPEMDEETKQKIREWTGLNVDDFTAGAGKGKKAYVIISDSLNPNKLEMVWTYKKVRYMVAFMNHMGYETRLLFREKDEELFKAMGDPEAGAVAYFGHEGSPAVGGLEADDLELTLADARKEGYMSQGMSESEARKKANAEVSMNLDIFYNHSCHSADEGYEQLAKLAVKQGGVYYGERGYLWATSSPETEYINQYE